MAVENANSVRPMVTRKPPYSPKKLCSKALAVSGTECSSESPMRAKLASDTCPSSTAIRPLNGRPACKTRTFSATERLCMKVMLLASGRPACTEMVPLNARTGSFCGGTRSRWADNWFTWVVFLSSYTPARISVSVWLNVVGNFSCHTPEDKMTKPVKVQITSVSIKGSRIDTIPSATGSLVFAEA